MQENIRSSLPNKDVGLFLKPLLRKSYAYFICVTGIQELDMYIKRQIDVRTSRPTQVTRVIFLKQIFVEFSHFQLIFCGQIPMTCFPIALVVGFVLPLIYQEKKKKYTSIFGYNGSVGVRKILSSSKRASLEMQTPKNDVALLR